MKIISLIGLIFLCGCAKDPISTNVTNNEKITVDLLFTNGGCSVYRFIDNGYYHYYANCKPGFTDERIRSGKTTRPGEGLPTI